MMSQESIEKYLAETKAKEDEIIAELKLTRYDFDKKQEVRDRLNKCEGEILAIETILKGK